MVKIIHRVTHEVITDGIVTYGKTATADTFGGAYRSSLAGDWESNIVVSSVLMYELDVMFDFCNCPEDLQKQEPRLSAIKALLATMGPMSFDKNEMQRLLQDEEDIRSGKRF